MSGNFNIWFPIVFQSVYSLIAKVNQFKSNDLCWSIIKNRVTALILCPEHAKADFQYIDTNDVFSKFNTKNSKQKKDLNIFLPNTTNISLINNYDEDIVDNINIHDNSSTNNSQSIGLLKETSLYSHSGELYSNICNDINVYYICMIEIPP